MHTKKKNHNIPVSIPSCMSYVSFSCPYWHCQLSNKCKNVPHKINTLAKLFFTINKYCLCSYVWTFRASVQVHIPPVVAAVNTMLGIVSDMICVFQPGVCCVCKPPITFAPNYTLKDVIRPACSIATQRDITQCTSREKVHTQASKHAHRRVLINILIAHT